MIGYIDRAILALNNATKIVIRRGSPGVIHATRLTAMDNATKIVICRGSPGVIHASRLTRGYSYDAAHSEYQCDKNRDLSRLTRNYSCVEADQESYDEAHSELPATAT